MHLIVVKTVTYHLKLRVEIDDASFTVTDNGVGLSPLIIKKSLNYLERVSDKALYVSPTRGQMGNALKVIWATPYVLDGTKGVVEVWSKDKYHLIEVSLDRISQKPKLEHTKKSGNVKNGTKIKIHLPDLTSLKTEKPSVFYNDTLTAQGLIEAYNIFNPHTTFHYDGKTYEATNKDWKKWKSDDATSPHWYNTETLRNLIAGYIKKENEGSTPKTVREFVSEFRGLSSTSKQKRVTDGFSGVFLHDLVKNMDIDLGFVENLLERMQAESKPVQPQILGIIGEEHIKKCLTELGYIEESLTYARRKGIGGGLPFLFEFASGVKENEEEGRRIITGMNWSPTLNIPANEILDAIAKMRFDIHDPVVVVIHLVKPRFEFTDKGKTRISL